MSLDLAGSLVGSLIAKKIKGLEKVSYIVDIHVNEAATKTENFSFLHGLFDMLSLDNELLKNLKDVHE